MRKHLLHLLLPLFMLLSQQGAVWHGIGHLTDGQRSAAAGSAAAHAADAHGAHDDQTHADPDPLSADQLCEICLAFDDLAASARSEPPALALAVASHVQAPLAAPASRSQPAPQPRSRGPPLVL